MSKKEDKEEMEAQEKEDDNVQEEVETTSDSETTEETAEEPEKKKGKTKKVVRRRKSKKEKERPLTGAVRLAVESGNVEFGSRIAISELKENKAKVFVMASNCPVEVKSKFGGTAIPVIEFEGTSMELGSVCGKPFPVAVLSVYSVGTSNLMELVKKKA